MDPVLANLTPILAFVGVLAASYFTYRGSNRKLKSDSGMQMIDQHQEEIAVLRAENSELRKNRRIQDDYIDRLRRHISDGNPPPPPPWPDVLVS